MTDTEAPHLYLITPPDPDPQTFPDQLAEVLEAAEIACVRLRTPDADEGQVRAAADALRPLCHDRDVALVLTDHFQLVAPLGVDGVHIERPGKLRDIRKALGPDLILGVSAGASRHGGIAAAEAGADYVAFGPVALEGALADGETADADLFEWWSEMIETPVVAEGGLTPDRARALATVTDFIAPRSSVWSHPDGPGAGIRAYVTALGG